VQENTDNDMSIVLRAEPPEAGGRLENNMSATIGIGARRAQKWMPQGEAAVFRGHFALGAGIMLTLMDLSEMFTMRAPNSTPIVRSWTGWKRLSVN